MPRQRWTIFGHRLRSMFRRSPGLTDVTSTSKGCPREAEQLSPGQNARLGIPRTRPKTSKRNQGRSPDTPKARPDAGPKMAIALGCCAAVGSTTKSAESGASRTDSVEETVSASRYSGAPNSYTQQELTEIDQHARERPTLNLWSGLSETNRGHVRKSDGVITYHPITRPGFNPEPSDRTGSARTTSIATHHQYSTSTWYHGRTRIHHSTAYRATGRLRGAALTAQSLAHAGKLRFLTASGRLPDHI